MLSQGIIRNHEDIEISMIMPKKRRTQFPWTLSEVKKLLIGVYYFGVGHWVIIHEMMKFDKRRTFSDLKDKWRNLTLEQRRSKVPVLYRKLAAAIIKKHTLNATTKPRFESDYEKAWEAIMQEFTPFVTHLISSNDNMCILVKD